ncbi:MAG: MBL fold metallo-hydrolase [Promethearchaeota archaeon]
MIKLYKISPNVFVATPENDTVNMGGFKLLNYSIAVDSGRSMGNGKELRNSLEKQFNCPIIYLLITHCHPDHINGITAFNETTLVFNKKTEPFLPKNFPKKEIFQPNKSLILKDQNSEVEIHHVGGHTPDSCFIYLPSEKVIFAGDLVFSGFKQPFPWSPGNSNPDKWIQAVKYILQKDLRTIIPGHGPILNKKELKNILDFYQNLRDLLLDSIAQGIKLSKIKAPTTALDYELFEKRGITLNEEFEKDLIQIGIRRRQATLRHWYQFYKKR